MSQPPEPMDPYEVIEKQGEEISELKHQINLLRDLITDSDTNSAWAETVLRKWAERANGE